MGRYFWVGLLGATCLLVGDGMAGGQAQAPAEVRGVRPQSALQNGIQFHLDGEFEAAEPFLRHADLYRQSLTPEDQRRLDDFLARNQQALLARRDALAQLYKANTALRNGRIAEADAILNTLKASKFLTAAERQQVNTLSQQTKQTTPTVPEESKTPLKTTPTGNRNADDVLRAAREAFNHQDYDHAIALAHQAQKSGYWSLLPWSDTPAKVINDVKAARDGIQVVAPTLAAEVRPAETIETIRFEALNGKTATVTIVKAGTEPTTASKSMSAMEAKLAVQQAREHLRQGNLDYAERLAVQARLATDAKYGYFDDTPDKVLKDVYRVRERSNQDRASILLGAARRKLQEHDYDEAERLACQSEALHPAYPLWYRGDRPEKIVAEVEQARRQYKRPEMPAIVDTPSSEKKTQLASAERVTRAPKPDDLPPLLDPAPTPHAKPAPLASAGAKTHQPTAQTDAATPLSRGDEVAAHVIVPSPKMPELRKPRKEAPTAEKTPAELVAASQEVPAPSKSPRPPSEPAAVDTRQRAQRTLALARQCIERHDYLRALHLMGEAKAMAWEAGDGDDTPDAVIEQLALVRQREVTSAQVPSADAMRQLATQYLIEARARQAEGRLLDALEATRLAQRCQATYLDGEETPEAVFKDLQDDCRKHLETYAAAAKALAEYGKKCQDANQPLANYERYFTDAERYVRYVLDLAKEYQLEVASVQDQVNAVRQIANQAKDGTGLQQANVVDGMDGRQLAIQAQAHLKLGRFSEARKAAAQLYNGPYDAGDEAKELLKNIDAAERLLATRSAQELYHDGVQAFARKDFVGAGQKLHGINVQFLDENKRSYVSELLARPELQEVSKPQ